MRQCPHCGESIPSTDSVCRYCGLPATLGGAGRPCPFCAETMGAGDRLCPWCGSDPDARRPCPHCKEPIAASDATCRYCGNDARVAPTAGEHTFVEWERPGRGVFARWWTTWAGSQFGFEKFWKRIPYSGGLGAPMKFAVFFYAQLMLLVGLCYSPVLVFPAIAAMQDPPKGWSPPMIVGVVLLGLLVAIPLLLLLSAATVYMTAALYHACVVMLGGRGGFEVTFRVVAYSYGSRLWDVACCMATIVFQTMAMSHGFRAGHGMSKERAVIAALIPQLLSFAALAVPYVIMIVQAAMR